MLLTEAGLDPRLAPELQAEDPDLALLWLGGVPGGVTPLPLALLSPITLTSSLTETPCSSGGMSLFTWCCAGLGLLAVGGLEELPRLREPSSLEKNEGFRLSPTDPPIPGDWDRLEEEGDDSRCRLLRGGGVGLPGGKEPPCLDWPGNA